MAFSREALNTAVSEKLADCNGAAVYHQGLFGVTQISGVAGIAGAILIAPLAIEVSIITGVAGLAFYGISQLLQTKRTGHFLPLPCVPVSAGQLGYVPSKMIAQLMNGTPPEPPDEVRLLPSDWLPQRERRINYLLTHCPDILITAAENAQEGISFAAIVDSAVRASEMAISDEQIQNPVLANKLRGDVRALLTGDTSRIEAQQTQAIAAEWKRAQLDHSNGQIDDDELRTIEADVRAIAPQLMGDDTAVNAVSTADSVVTIAAQPDDDIRTDWQAVFALIKDQNTYPAIAIIGPQGLGKTTLVEYLLSLITHSKLVLDPHYEMGAWPGCKVVGAGMDYDAVSEALATISADVKERYRLRATVSGYKPEPVSLVLEEQTNWVAKVDGAGKFLKETLSDIRKVGYQAISVAHGTTNTARGGAAGTAKMRDQGELRIELVEKGLAKVSLKGRETFMLRYPDPKSYTVAAGRAEVVRTEQQTIDVEPVAAEPTTESAKPQQPTQATKWAAAMAKLKENQSPYLPFAEWVESRSDGFTLKLAKENKQLRAAMTDESIGDSQRQRVENAFNAFRQWGLIVTLDGVTFTAV